MTNIMSQYLILKLTFKAEFAKNVQINKKRSQELSIFLVYEKTEE